MATGRKLHLSDRSEVETLAHLSPEQPDRVVTSIAAHYCSLSRLNVRHPLAGLDDTIDRLLS